MKNFNNEPDPEVVKVRDQIIKKIGNKSLEEVNVIIKKLLNGQMDEITRLGALAARVKILRMRIEDLYERRSTKKLKKSPISNIEPKQEAVKQEKEEEWIKIKMLVASDVNGKQLDKGVILEIKKDDGDKLISLNKAELIKQIAKDESSKENINNDNKNLKQKIDQKETLNKKKSGSEEKVDEQIKRNDEEKNEKKNEQKQELDSKEKNILEGSKKDEEIEKKDSSKQVDQKTEKEINNDIGEASDMDLLKLHEQKEVKKSQSEIVENGSDSNENTKIKKSSLKQGSVTNIPKSNSIDEVKVPSKDKIEQSVEDFSSDSSIINSKSEEEESNQSVQLKNNKDEKE